MDKNEFINIVKPYTMTSVERIGCLFDSLEYIRLNNIEGDFVECGVWKGGNIFGIIEYLKFHNIENRKVWLYDTFEGMTEPGNFDIDLNNNKAKDIFKSVICYSPLDEVKALMNISEFNKENLIYVVGDINETLNNVNNIPSKISILRLDTDWYDSTKKELEVLFPVLSYSGVMIVDDYGHWAGSRKAVDEYLGAVDKEIIDYTGIRIFKN